MREWLEPMVILGLVGCFFGVWIALRLLNHKIYELNYKHEATSRRVERWEEDFRKSVESMDSKITSVKSNLENVKSKLFQK